MKTKTFYYLFLAIIMSFATVTCTPEDGRDGNDGEQGPAGEDGTANVIYSNWMPISWNDADEPFYKAMSIIEPLITEEFITTGGTILMFFKYEQNPIVVVYPLPLTQVTDLLSYYYGVSAIFSGLIVTVNSLDGTTPVSPSWVNPAYSIRYVLIPGGIPLGKNQNWENVDKNNYEEVAAYLGIKN